ncbi:MAG: rod-binding protein [Planctomycetota bacterium]
MDGLQRLDRATMHPVDPDVKLRREARDVARQFEGVLVRTLVASLRETASFGAEGSGMFGGGPGADTYADWFDQHVTDELTDSGRIGVADVLMREFERWKQIPAERREPGLLQVDRSALRRQDLPLRAMNALPTTLSMNAPATGGIDVAA